MPVTLEKSYLGEVTLTELDAPLRRVEVRAGGFLIGHYITPHDVHERANGYFVALIAPDGQDWLIGRAIDGETAARMINTTSWWYDYRPHPLTIAGTPGNYRVDCITCNRIGGSDYGARARYGSIDDARLEGVAAHQAKVCPAEVVGLPGGKPWRLAHIKESFPPPNSPYYRPDGSDR